MQPTPPHYSVTASSVTTCPTIYWTEKESFVVTATMNYCVKSLKQWTHNCWISPPGKPNLSKNGYIRLELKSGMVPSSVPIIRCCAHATTSLAVYTAIIPYTGDW